MALRLRLPRPSRALVPGRNLRPECIGLSEMANWNDFEWTTAGFETSCDDACGGAYEPCDPAGFQVLDAGTIADILYAAITGAQCSRFLNNAVPDIKLEGGTFYDCRTPESANTSLDCNYSPLEEGYTALCPCGLSDSGATGDPHFQCPQKDLRFDFDGTQATEGGREFYTLLSDGATDTTVNVAFESHAFAGEHVNKTFTHMTEVYVAVGHEPSRAIDLSVSYGPRDAFPVLRHSNASTVLDWGADERFVRVSHRPCEYMQPDQYAASKRAGQPYTYRQTSNLCTFVSLDLPTLHLDIVGVAAGLEADGVGKQGNDTGATATTSELLSEHACLWRLDAGLNYLNVKVRSWKHSVTQLSGILSHCFDGSLLGKKCPKCFGDRIGALQDRPRSAERVDASQSSDLVTSEDFHAQGDHEFDVDGLTAFA
eukprot:scaffold1516_cov266-Prasinococcus_capsulatus_cf.AAC.7